jgi:hypothetical protein
VGGLDQESLQRVQGFQEVSKHSNF